MSEQEKVLTPSIEKPIVTEPGSAEQAGSLERVAEKPQEKVSETIVTPQATVVPEPNATPVPVEVERAAEIERILESDLSDVYFNLPENKREEFRVRGEQTAQEINTMLSSAKASAHKIIKLIKSWLLLIPGVNKFFLEQEAKLKTDQILKINERL